MCIIIQHYEYIIICFKFSSRFENSKGLFGVCNGFLSPDSAGCDDRSRAADVHCSTCRPVTVPGSSGLAERGPGAPSLQQPNMVIGTDGQNISPCLIDGRCGGGPEMETRCVCVYGQRGADGPGPSWSGSPYMYLRGEVTHRNCGS